MPFTPFRKVANDQEFMARGDILHRKVDLTNEDGTPSPFNACLIDHTGEAIENVHFDDCTLVQVDTTGAVPYTRLQTVVAFRRRA